MRILFLVILLLPLVACDDILSDCLDLDGPEFNATTVPAAILNQVYDVTISASINNNPNDDLYDYEISFSGNLPNGLTIYRDDNDRTIQIIGTPTELGSYEFTLKVKVTDPRNISSTAEDVNDLCYTNHVEDYGLVVTIS